MYAEVIALVLAGVGVAGYFDRKNLKADFASLKTKADADLKVGFETQGSRRGFRPRQSYGGAANL